MSNRLKKSSFPPIIEEQQSPNKIVSMSQHSGTEQPLPVAVKRERLKMNSWGSRGALLQANDKLARQRKIKRAKAILVAWEELQKQERDSKYSALKEKVILQRELISRQDQQLATSSRLAAVTQNRKDDKRKCLKRDTAGPAPSRRQKKSRATNKLQTSTTVKMEPSTPSEQTSPSDDMSVTPPATPTSSDHTVPTYSFRPPQNRILQILGVSQEVFEQLKIEDMWAGLKAHASKELNKANAYIRLLKKESSPSVRECMELYDEPISCDPYTGKSLLLSDRLRVKQLMVTSERKYTLRSSKATASLKSWCAKQQLDKQRETLLSNHGGLGWLTGIQYDSSKEPACDGDRPQLPTVVEQRSPQQRRSKSVTILTEPEVITGDVTWQPLSVGALVESNGVSVREVRTPLKSSLKTWRPPPIITQ